MRACVCGVVLSRAGYLSLFDCVAVCVYSAVAAYDAASVCVRARRYAHLISPLRGRLLARACVRFCALQITAVRMCVCARVCAWECSVVVVQRALA